jgi:hypothetical protein
VQVHGSTPAFHELSQNQRWQHDFSGWEWPEARGKACD